MGAARWLCYSVRMTPAMAEGGPSTAHIGRVIWITGLSGAGKTTLAVELSRRLKAAGQLVVTLDGDDLRFVLAGESGNPTGYGRDERVALSARYARLAQLISMQSVTVVVATISLFREVHAWNRKHVPNYFEVYLRVPLDELRRRDPRGLYRRFDAGEMRDVAGLDLEIDEPQEPDLLIEFSPSRGPDDLASDVMSHLPE